MNTRLQALCDRMIENRDVLRGAFRWESDRFYPVCANLFCVRGVTPDPERLAAARSLLNAETGLFSNLRGHVRLPLICTLSMDEDPAERLRRIQDLYSALKGHFHASDYLAFAALSLSDQEGGREAAEERAWRLYRRMKAEHRFLTGEEDSLFAAILACSPRDDDALIADMEESYTLLRQTFRDGDSVQSVSHVLALDSRTPKEKAARLTDLYDALTLAGCKYGRGRELGALAALSLADAEIQTLAAEMAEAGAYLAEQKGWRGLLGFDRRTRAMHAAMLVTDLYLPAAGAETAAFGAAAGAAASAQATLAAVLAAQTACCVAACAAASSSSH